MRQNAGTDAHAAAHAEMPPPTVHDAPELVEITRIDTGTLAAEAIAGLGAAHAAVSPKFLYDPLGSRLFDAITELPEYYLTRTEARILDDHLGEIARALRALAGERPTLVDLGAGNCQKARRYFGPLDPRSYVAVDISADFLRDSLATLQRAHPSIRMLGAGLDFSVRLALPPALVDGPAVVLYPGSSIGNFAPDDALRLLREARALAAGGALLIGVDLVKARSVLEAAYDDALGVTAAFNLNLLAHLNRLIGADFSVRDWRHVALFDERASRIEMHLEARRALEVRWPGGGRRFAAGERIHTENSYKWTTTAFESLLHAAGYARTTRWTDPGGAFAVYACGG